MRFLERTIHSVLDQGYPNLEFIIVDDHSSDGSMALAEKYADRLTLVRNDRNMGQSATLNRGFTMATGDIIGWQNSDDVYLPGAFEVARATFASRPEADIVFGDRLTIDDDDATLEDFRYTRFWAVVHQYDGIAISNQSAFWRRSVFDRIGYLDPALRFAMDYEFYLRAARSGMRFLHVRGHLGAARRYAGNRTNDFGASTPFRAELESIDRRHGRQHWADVPLRVAALAYRTIGYVLQGDAAYVVRGVARRLRSGQFLSGTT